MAIVSPLLTPLTGPAVKAAPLMEMEIQPVLQVALRFEKPPARVTVLLVMVELTATLVWFVKLKAFGVGVVVTDHKEEVVPPTVTMAVVAVL
jgi:hypothetical protein